MSSYISKQLHSQIWASRITNQTKTSLTNSELSLQFSLVSKASSSNFENNTFNEIIIHWIKQVLKEFAKNIVQSRCDNWKNPTMVSIKLN